MCMSNLSERSVCAWYRFTDYRLPIGPTKVGIDLELQVLSLVP
jgi:hypothetical protein